MAGTGEDGSFRERVSPFLEEKMRELREKQGEESGDYRALFLQYRRLDQEGAVAEEANRRHWEADLEVGGPGWGLRGMERLYRNSIVIEPTMVCAAHCRYCLRASYEMFTLDEEELRAIAKYCGGSEVRDEVSEVLVSGGDPLVVPRRLGYLIDCLVELAPNIRIVRIGTRLPQQDPRRVDDGAFEVFRKYRDTLRFEVGIQVNHPIELFPEVVDKLTYLQSLGVKMYAQNVLLKGVNDTVDDLVRLYRRIRELNVEAHYLFHAVPMKGTHHLRTSVLRGTQLVGRLVNSGLISGRAKPMYALMTDIGKITLYDGVILARREGRILLQSTYDYRERVAWNPSWKLPATAEVDDGGLLRVWYLDGTDD
jgi:lysine 2,3-aminomutase